MKLDVEGRLIAVNENLDPHNLIFEPARSLILKANRPPLLFCKMFLFFLPRGLMVLSTKMAKKFLDGFLAILVTFLVKFWGNSLGACGSFWL